MENFGDEAIQLITEYGFRVVGVIIFVIFAWVFAGWCRAAIKRTLDRAKLDPTLSQFFSNSLRWLILLLAGLACLSIFGVQTTSFAAVIGAAGLAIGLGFQGSLSNLASGVMLLIFRPFNVGDYVQIGGENGHVVELGLFTTHLDTLDNRRIILPNGSVFGSTIENFTFNPIRRVDIDVGVEYSADLDQTRAVLEGAIEQVELRLPDQPHEVFLVGLGGSSVDWQVRVWCDPKDYWGVWDATTVAVKKALDHAGLGIPFPQMDVHLDGRLQKVAD